jgi:hypothetical protein
MVEVMEMRRQNQNQQVRQVNQVAWPEVIYLTPDRWGDETFALTREELRETVRSLRRLGAEWRRVSMIDATPIRLIDAQGDDTAIYGYGVHPVYGGGKLYKVRRHRTPGGARYDWEQVQ